MAAVRAIYDTLRALRTGTPAERLEGIADEELMRRVMRSEDYARWTKEWL
jgi:carboxyvinyl-carboxyphosphonate phosphorylmutase